MELYENFMNTAKIIWEEFTGSNNKPVKSEKKDKRNKDKTDHGSINPPKVAISKLLRNIM